MEVSFFAAVVVCWLFGFGFVLDLAFLGFFVLVLFFKAGLLLPGLELQGLILPRFLAASAIPRELK